MNVKQILFFKFKKKRKIILFQAAEIALKTLL